MENGSGKAPAAIRPARREDAEAVARLANELGRLFDLPSTFTPAKVLADGFDGALTYSLLVAERRRRVVGYALYHPQYNSDVPGWGLWLTDLFVEEAERRRGTGRALLAAVAAATLEGGYVSLWWGVLDRNRGARDFYARLGAKDEQARILELEGAALSRLAAERG